MGDFADLAEFPVEYLSVEEDDGIECLVLGGGRDFEVCGEVSEESADFYASHGERVLFVVEEDKSFDPVGIGLDGSGAEVTECGCSADEVEEFGLRHGQLPLEVASAAYRTVACDYAAATQDLILA